MSISIENCDLNNDYFHFTNKKNVDSILNKGLIPTVGAASRLVDDEPNVSVSQGGKGIMGIINSFLYKFSKELKVDDIPDEFKKYFTEISDFSRDDYIGEELASKAMIRKLKDEVYFRVGIDDSQLSKAKIGGLTGYDITLPIGIDKSNIDIVTDSNNKALSAYDVAMYIYEKVKDRPIFREMNEQFFKMCEIQKPQEILKKIVTESIETIGDLSQLSEIDTHIEEQMNQKATQVGEYEYDE